MFDLKTLKRAIDQIAEEKGIDPAKILEAIESSIAAAYKKEYGQRGELIKTKFDLKTGGLKFWQVKTVVDETTVRMIEEGAVSEESLPAGQAGVAPTPGPQEENVLPRYNPDRHILVDEAKKISAEGGSASGGKKDIKVGDELEFPLEVHEDFGRIAAQTAKQVILQRLREAERDSVLSEFKNREGEI